MGKWKKYVFKDIAKFIDYRGKTPKKTSDGTPLITAKNVRMGYVSEEPREYIATKDYEDWMTRGIPNVGDILFTTEAPLGNVAELTFSYKIALAQRLVTFQPLKDNYISKFLKYYLLSPIFQKELWSKATGTTVKGIKTSILKKFEIPLPPLPEQKRIVAKLDGLFAKIDQAIGLLEENIAHTQALMGSVLDDEFGKLSKFNKPLMSFCANPKKDMVGGPFGSNLKASEYVEKGYPIIRLQNVDRFNFKEKNIMFVTEEKAGFLSSHSYISGDIVMTKLGDPLGKCCIVEDVHGVDRGVISSDIIRIRIDENKNYKPYVVAGINSEYFIKQLKSKTQGSTRPRVKLKEVREMQLPMLKKDEQIVAAKRIDGILELQSKVLTTQTKKLNDLKALKISLLDQAFKGEL